MKLPLSMVNKEVFYMHTQIQSPYCICLAVYYIPTSMIGWIKFDCIMLKFCMYICVGLCIDKKYTWYILIWGIERDRKRPIKVIDCGFQLV